MLPVYIPPLVLGDAVMAREQVREDVAFLAEDQSKTLVTTKYEKKLLNHSAAILNMNSPTAT